jgi:hypothetical protein
MSPRAACRLETLGFTEVYDYVAGKVDWLAHNLPVESTAALIATVGRYLRTDVITAGLDEYVAAVRARVAASPYSFALVTGSDDDTVLGLLRRSALDRADSNDLAVAVMESGPSTLRPHELAADVHARLRHRDATYAIVTDPEGHLLGTFHAADVD